MAWMDGGWVDGWRWMDGWVGRWMVEDGWGG